jgi:putative Mg2+ transporter-C (MgtC) family protein
MEWTEMIFAQIDWELAVRLLLACICGALVGGERKRRHKDAGIRTHVLVSLGAALITMVSSHGFGGDPSRVAANIVTGIGFIGAGAIIFQKHIVRGITTAAGIWVTPAIGMACGGGHYSLSVATTLLVLFCLETFNFILGKMGKKTVSLSITARSRYEVNSILEKLKTAGFSIDTYNIEMTVKDDKKIYVITLDVKVRRKEYDKRIAELIAGFDEVYVDNIQG